MAEITLTPGTLPPPACFPTEQARFDAYVAAILATITGGLQWQAGAVAPSDVAMFWLRQGGSGTPGLEPLKWSTPDAAWTRWLSSIHNTGTSGGSSNAYTITQSPAAPPAEAYRLGATYIFRATFANTGAATLSVDGLAAVPIKRRSGTDLEGGDIEAGLVVVVIHDGTNFQMVTPTVVKKTQFGYLYAEGNTTAAPPLAPGDIILSVTKPASAKWEEFEVNACLAWRASTTNVGIECRMTFETAPLTAQNVTTKAGCGNSPQQMLGQGVDDDSNNAFWRRLGPVPSEWASVNTISFKVHAEILAGSFENPSTFYAFARCTYTEPAP